MSLEIPISIRNYIDTLTDDERDRVIEAPQFRTDGGYKPALPERTSIRQKVTQYIADANFRRKPSKTKDVEYIQPAQDETGCLINIAKQGTTTEGYGTVGCDFDKFVRQYKQDAITAIKQYAAKRNTITLPIQTPVSVPMPELQKNGV